MKINVIKVGGAVVENEQSLIDFLHLFVNIEGAKILVHGGGRSATALASELGIETQMVSGRRITDQSMLRVVTMVYGGLVNKNIVAHLQSLNQNAIGLTGADLNYITAVKRPIKEGINYGFVGDITEVRITHLLTLLNINTIPVLAPLTHDGHGQMLNTNADTIASSVATALARAGHETVLTYCFDKAGVLSSPNDDSSVIPLLNEQTYNTLLADNIISDGMIPKVDNAFDALHNGVSEVVITSASNLVGGTHIVL